MAALADKLQIWGFEDNFAVFNDGSIGFALKSSGIDVTAKRDEEVDSLSQNISTFLNGLPEETDIQFILSITGNNDHTFNAFEQFAENSTNEISRNIALERLKHLKNESAGGLLPKYDLLILARRQFSKNFFQKKTLFRTQKDFDDKLQGAFEQELREAAALRNEIIQGLVTIGIHAVELSDEDIFKEIYLQWNPTRDFPQGADRLYDPNYVRESLLFTDALLYENGFALAETHHRVISLKLLPQEVVSGMAREFLNLPIGSKVFISLKHPKQQKEIERLQLQRRTAYAMAHGKTGVSDIESEAKLADVENILTELISQREHIFEVSVNVVLRHKDPLVLDEMVREGIFTLRSLSGAEGMTESLASFDIFSELAIPNARAKERARKMKTTFATEFVPAITPWEGHALPKALLKTKSNTLLKFDPMDPSLTNFNQIVSGGSGSGKSFCANLLLLQMTKFSPKIFILDIGASYRKICDALDSQYINFSLESGQALNPFDLAADQTSPDSIKIKFLVALVELMTKEDGFEHLGKLERAEIEEAIKKVYKGPRDTWTLSNLREILLTNSEPSVLRLGRVLAPWVGDTSYGSFLDSPTTIKLSSQIICFDLKGLESFPDLQSVCLYTITDFIWREVQKDPSQMKFVVLDECWKLLESESGSIFIAELFRTFRKYFASAIAISQNIDDFAKSKVATAILPNSAVKWILKQKDADQARLIEVLALNPNEHDLIENIAHSKGSFSQAFLMAGDNRAMVSIEPTPLEYWLATTDSRDLAAISKYQTDNPSVTLRQTLEMLSKEYPRGIAGTKSPHEKGAA